MSRFDDTVRALCAVNELPDPQSVIDAGAVELQGFTILLDELDGDPDAMYLRFEFGLPTAGRTMRVFLLMLEANITVYALDQAQMGCDPDTGSANLMVRIPYDDASGEWLSDTLAHYVEHGKYWRKILATTFEEMYADVCSGRFTWLLA